MDQLIEPRSVIAVLWPAGRPLPMATPLPTAQFFLVSSPADYQSLSSAGLNCILVQKRPSEHFAVPLAVRILGPLIVPWRWRRTLLNEGIETVVVTKNLASVPVAIAAWLAGAPITTRLEPLPAGSTSATFARTE